MKEAGIIFSGNHPKLILDLIKTMTRRTYGLEDINKNPDNWLYKGVYASYADFSPKVQEGYRSGLTYHIKCPYGQVGDRLWVRETTWRGLPISPIYDADLKDAERADYWDMGCRKVPSMFIPKKASRILLEITELRVERLQEISAGDCTREGIPYEDGDYVAMKVFDKFRDLWDSLNAKRGFGWETNPFVWVISFKLVGNNG